MKFSIRDLLLLTVIAALGVSWWIDRQAITRERASIKAEFDKRQLLLRDRAVKLDADFTHAMEQLRERERSVRRVSR